MRKMLSTLLAVMILLASSTTQVFASEVTAPGEATTSAVLNTEATLMNVTLPLAVMIYVDADGNVFTPDNLQITNNSAGPIQVLSLEVVTDNGWTLDPTSTDYTDYKSGLKHFSMTLNGMDPALGDLTFTTPINGGESLLLEFEADVSPQKDALNAVKIGEMIITVDWYADEVTTPSYPPGYVLATDSDFSGDSDGSFTYTGIDEYVIIPDTIKGVPVTSYAFMFMSKPVKGVISENPNITNMSYMFAFASSTNLELRLNTTSTTDMSAMFTYAAAESLGLGSFDMATVTTTTDMFAGCTAVVNWDSSTLTGPGGSGTGGSGTGGTVTVETGTYVLASDSDFIGDIDGELTYMGTDSFVIIPDVIKGIPVTSYKNMFAATSVKGVISTNPNITSAEAMFAYNTANTLEIDLSACTNIVNTSGMFSHSSATAIDLSKMSTSSVFNTSYMFYNTQVTTLDLSTWNLASMDDIWSNNMFNGVTATAGYARTQTDADKLNATSNKPAGLTFVVK
jgi:hypothetical protein